MPEPGKKKRIRKSTTRAREVKETNGAHPEPLEPPVGNYHERDLEGLLRDHDVMKKIVHALTQRNVLGTFVEDVSQELADALRSNPDFRQQLVRGLVFTESSRCKLARSMAKWITD